MQALESLTHGARTGNVREGLFGIDPSSLRPIATTPEAVINAAAPKLTLQEEIYALSLVDLVQDTLGTDVRALVAGDIVTEPQALVRVLVQFASSGMGQEFLGRMKENSPVVAQVLRRLLNTDNTGKKNSEGESLSVLTTAVEGLTAQEIEVLGKTLEDAMLELRTKLVRRLDTL